MKKLELLIPPPVILILCSLAMWNTSRLEGPEISIPLGLWLAVALAIIALTIFCLAGRELFRAKTTVSPFSPEQTSSLVRSGIFKYSRNPMYLSALLLLTAWGIFLAKPLPFVFPAGFFLYVTLFQILPEEKILAQRFGEAYAAYKSETRRWL